MALGRKRGERQLSSLWWSHQTGQTGRAGSDMGVGVNTGLDKEIKPYGCGQFVYESYLIFCCGRGASIQATDKNLRAYCAWLRRELGRGGAVDAVDMEA